MSWINTIPLPSGDFMKGLATGLKEKKHLALMDARDDVISIYTNDDVSVRTRKFFPVDEFGKSLLDTAPLAKHNMVERGIHRMSLVMKEMPSYDYGESAEGESVEIPEYYRPMKRWLFMKSAERLSNLLGTVLLHARRGTVNGKEGIIRQVITWYLPLFGDDPLTPEAIIYPFTTPSNDITQDAEILWAFWNAESFVIFNTNGQHIVQPDNLEEKNEIGRLPFVALSTRELVDEHFSIGYGFTLADVNDAINIMMTEGRGGVRLNLLGQWWTQGLEKNSIIKMGINNVVNLPSEATLNNEAGSGDITSLVENVKFEVELALQNIGMKIQWGDSADQPSGESLKAASIELLERREDDVPVIMMADMDLYEIEQAIAEKTDLAALPKERTMNYKEVDFPAPAKESRDQLDWDWENGLSTPVDELLRRNPDGFQGEDREKKAQDQILTNKAINADVGLRKTDQPEATPGIFNSRGSQ